MKISSPTLIVNKEQVITNITRMVDLAQKHNLFFRPHFKTHQSHMIGNMFRQQNVKGITVSSVEMAEYFQQNGWDDITIAFPYNFLEIEKVNRLAAKCALSILIVNKEAMLHLRENLIHEISFFIEIDNSYHRTGIDPEDTILIDRILSLASKNDLMKFKGFLTHAGNSYQAEVITELKNIHHSTMQMMISLKNRYLSAYPDLLISIGDTPCCSMMEDFTGIDEIRPGNFVFYDLMQEKLGSCTVEQIAVALACPVVAKNLERLEIAIYGGAAHLSKEYILDTSGNMVFGKIVLFNDQGWSSPLPDTYVLSLSQEHGIISTTSEVFGKINPGTLIGVLPVHSCLTAAAMGEYITIEDEIIDHM